MKKGYELDWDEGVIGTPSEIIKAVKELALYFAYEDNGMDDEQVSYVLSEVADVIEVMIEKDENKKYIVKECVMGGMTIDEYNEDEEQ